ncbi:hypothetical protein D1007_36497 [Hordeum vulgare]|nr:hypothetical protein D1007_36497 [Hordeum vulgare]
MLRAALPPLSYLPDDESLLSSPLEDDGYIDQDDYIDDNDGYIDCLGYDYIDDDDIHIINGRRRQHHLNIIHGKDDTVNSEANCWYATCALWLYQPSLTEYKKVRARNMMRNNRMFQSLGIGAIASMIRKTNDVREGRINEVQEGTGVINDDPEYNSKEDEVIDGEEMDDAVVNKTVKALKESRTMRSGVKKTASKKRKSSETSAAMPPGSVMAPPPGETKRILQPDESAPDRVTRQKAKMAAMTDHQESPLYAITSKHRLRKGKGLERITKSLGTKVPIQIAEGMKHPEKPLQEAKFASDCGLIARSHLPILPHFKE